MRKIKINVPAGIRFISEWKNFSDQFPKDESYILDKKIPGCGFTEWVLGNERNTILCSPRVILIRNKWEQHKDSVFDVYYNSGNKYPGIDIEASELKRKMERRAYLIQTNRITGSKTQPANKDGLDVRFKKYMAIRGNKPYKIMVTYDSFKKVREILEKLGIFKTFDIYIDEFQSIFTDVHFRGVAELNFMNSLKGCHPCYVSATPMMEKYLDEMREFCKLPYYDLDWSALDPGRVIRPGIETRPLGRSISDVVKRITDTVLDPSKMVYTLVKDENGNIVKKYSREVVIYLNSVTNIIGVIKRCNLQPGNVNILCSNTNENRKRIKRRLGAKYSIGKVPLKGEKNKPVTFCTRTVYLGADFWSDNARSFIISNTRTDNMSLDISLDLPQILGRQRNYNNPWKSKAVLYYNISRSKKSLSELKTIVQMKANKTLHGELDAYRNMTDFQKESFIEDRLALESIGYNKDYLFITDDKKLKFNKLLMLAEQRAVEIHGIDYASQFNMLSAIDQSINRSNTQLSQELSNFYTGYKAILDNPTKDITYRKLKYICNAGLSDIALRQVMNILDDTVRSLLVIGIDRVKELKCDLRKIKEEIDLSLSKEDLKDLIFNTFHVGDRLLIPDIKSKLKVIYDKLGIKKTPKATSLNEWFELKYTYINRIRGYEIIRVK